MEPIIATPEVRQQAPVELEEREALVVLEGQVEQEAPKGRLSAPITTPSSS